MPAAVRSNDPVRLLRSPAAPCVRAHSRVAGQDWSDHRPGGFDRIFAGKQRSIADQSVAQQALVRRLAARLLLEEIQLPLLPQEILPRTLDASRERDRRTGRES